MFPVTRRLFLTSSVGFAAAVILGQERPEGSVTGLEIPANCWPWWRGPNCDNIVPSAAPPIHWSATKNLRWKVELTGRGHASPTVWGNRIFIVTALEESELLEMLCFDRATGDLLWKTELHQGGFMKKHDKNSHASATPACDGELVFFPALYENALWLTALNLAGVIKWQKRVSGFVPSNGYGSSPVLYRNAVIVACDNTGEPCLAAFQRASGALLWKVDRPKADNFSTPALARLAGRPQLVLCGAHKIASYDPATGEQIWFVESPTEVTACTPACGDGFVFAGGNVPVRESICVRANGKGNVTETHVAWRSKKNVTYVPTPVIQDGLLYIINDSGIAYCIDLATGDEIYKERIGGDFSSSPVLAGNRIYATNEKGETAVLRVGKKFEILARNSLGEEVFATPVFLGNQVIFRTAHHLICVEGK